MTTQQFTQDEIEYLWGSLEADREDEEYRAFVEWFYSQID